jgi:4-hydroxy-tetrahydrodipicolinate reductase
MRIALIGNGAMGQLVAAEARAGGHEIGEIITSGDADTAATDLATRLRGHDLAIDFSVAAAVERNVKACTEAALPLVEGTTGWQSHKAEVCQIVLNQNGALVYGANFSVGVNLFYKIVAYAAELFSQADYAPFIEEAHHQRKRDAPSGTALRLQELLQQSIAGEISIASTRAGSIPGTHRVGFDAAADQIMLTHTARSRAGFAAGALLAANWIVGRQGVFEFAEVLNSSIIDHHLKKEAP